MESDPEHSHLSPRLLDQVRTCIRTRHYSRRTEDSYVHWIRRFILFHGKRHPVELGAKEVEAFLSDLAVQRNARAQICPGSALGRLLIRRETFACFFAKIQRDRSAS